MGIVNSAAVLDFDYTGSEAFPGKKESKPVNRTFLITIAAAAAAFSLQAQTAPLIGEAKQAYTGIKNNLMKAAEKMPEENYGFKPVAEIRSFGQEVAHVADAQIRNCSALNGDAKTPGAASKTAKADLVAALKESFAECDKAFDGTTEANAMEMTKGARPRTRIGVLIGNTTHDNEMYGAMAVYMRLKGIVPPSSEGR
jgi:hypothetical protein